MGQSELKAQPRQQMNMKLLLLRFRTLIALLENFQQADGSVRIPAALAAYTGFKEIGAAGGGSRA